MPRLTMGILFCFPDLSAAGPTAGVTPRACSGTSPPNRGTALRKTQPRLWLAGDIGLNARGSFRSTERWTSNESGARAALGPRAKGCVGNGTAGHGRTRPALTEPSEHTSDEAVFPLHTCQATDSSQPLCYGLCLIK